MIIPVLKLDEFSKEGLETFIRSLSDMKENYDSEKPSISKLIYNERDLRLQQQQMYLDMLETSASQLQLKTFTIPVDQAFKKAQEVHIPVQNLAGTKKETLSVITDIALEIMAG